MNQLCMHAGRQPNKQHNAYTMHIHATIPFSTKLTIILIVQWEWERMRMRMFNVQSKTDNGGDFSAIQIIYLLTYLVYCTDQTKRLMEKERKIKPVVASSCFDPLQNRNPLTDQYKIWHRWLRPGDDVLYQIWFTISYSVSAACTRWRSVKKPCHNHWMIFYYFNNKYINTDFYRASAYCCWRAILI